MQPVSNISYSRQYKKPAFTSKTIYKPIRTIAQSTQDTPRRPIMLLLDILGFDKVKDFCKAIKFSAKLTYRNFKN